MTKNLLAQIISGWKAYIAEFLGTFVFILVSLGTFLANSFLGEVGLLGIALAAGFSYVAMVFATVHLSGGYLNPAITLALWFSRKVSATNAFFYILAQFLAGFAAVFALMYIFSASPADFSLWQQLAGGEVTLQKVVIVEAIFTSILVFAYFATMVDKRGSTSFGPFALGLVVIVSILVATPISAGIINPAKALAPAIVSSSYNELLAWVVGPFVGSLFGLVYEFIFLRSGKK